jgi:AhpD family alkylhydroperoxidase
MAVLGDPNPAISLRRNDLMESVRHDITLSRRLQELIRLRIAFHNQCRYCMAARYEEAIEDGLTEDAVCALEHPQEAPDLTDAERAALRFAELFATNHLAIDDALVEDLRRHFTEREIYEIGVSCACFVGFGRLAAISSEPDSLLEAFPREAEEPLTPWGARATFVLP